jgi:hypothetical protein
MGDFFAIFRKNVFFFEILAFFFIGAFEIGGKF